MHVVLFSRRPRHGQNFSIESIVHGLTHELSKHVSVKNVVAPFQSNGIVRRLYNGLDAARRQGDVNHITGDVHYLAYFMNADHTVLTIHDCARIAGTMDLRKRIIRELWFRLPIRHSRVVTVVSHTVKAELLEHVNVNPKKIRVIPSFVPSMFRRFDRPFNQACPTILHVGTAANKNLERLCAALRDFRCKLVVVGKLSPTQRVALTENSLDYENFVGISTERMLQLYVDCDVVAFASTFEGFGMPIIEGNLVGRPVLTSNIASMPEVAADAACIVDPYDPVSIRRGLEKITSDTAYRQALVERGFVNAERFDASTIAKAYIEIYQEIFTGEAPADVPAAAAPSQLSGSHG